MESSAPARITECRKKIIKQIDTMTAHLSDAELYELLVQLQGSLGVNLSRLEKKGV